MWKSLKRQTKQRLRVMRNNLYAKFKYDWFTISVMQSVELRIQKTSPHVDWTRLIHWEIYADNISVKKLYWG